MHTWNLFFRSAVALSLLLTLGVAGHTQALPAPAKLPGTLALKNLKLSTAFRRPSAGKQGGIGSAGVLTGSVFILHVFVSRPDAPWSPAAKQQMAQHFTQATAWLQQRAQEQGQMVSFSGGAYGWEQDVSVNALPGYDGTYSAVTPELTAAGLATRLGASSPAELLSYLRSYSGCENVAVILWPNTPGRSYAMPSTDASSSDRALEVTVCFPSFPGGQTGCAATIAHELLHLFGAWDLYENHLVSASQATEAERLFPNDIMRRISYTMDDLDIGGVTAWRIGWQPQQEDWYNFFRPTGDASKGVHKGEVIPLVENKYKRLRLKGSTQSGKSFSLRK